jgi:Tol biopolymer transport system component
MTRTSSLPCRIPATLRCPTLGILAVVGATLAAAACTDTNITGPAAGAGGVVVFSSDRRDKNFEIYRIAGNGADARRLTTHLEHADLSPSLSHDGSRIAWEREIAGPGGVQQVELWVMNADGSDAHVVVRNGSENRSPSWGAGDATLYYASFATGNWEIFRQDLATGAVVNLTNDPFADQYPRVSPDGRFVAFHTNRDVQFEIYVMAADGSAPHDVSNDPEDDRYPSWSPDGARIAWSRYIDSFDLYTMKADGTDQRIVSTTPYQELGASFSPDGASLVYQTNRYPPFGLEIIAVGGGTARPLVIADAAPGADLSPSWSAGR